MCLFHLQLEMMALILDPGYLHNVIPWVLVVAAGSIDQTSGGNLILGNGVSLTGWTMFPAKALVKDVPLFYYKNISTCDSAKRLALLSQT